MDGNTLFSIKMSKMEKGLMDVDNSVVIAGVGAIRGLNGKGKEV